MNYLTLPHKAHTTALHHQTEVYIYEQTQSGPEGMGKLHEEVTQMPLVPTPPLPSWTFGLRSWLLVDKGRDDLGHGLQGMALYKNTKLGSCSTRTLFLTGRNVLEGEY